MKIPHHKEFEDPPSPSTMQFLGGQRGYFKKLSKGSETMDMISEGWRDIFEGDFAIPLLSMEGQVDPSILQRCNKNIEHILAL